jgi:hypothetical protein
MKLSALMSISDAYTDEVLTTTKAVLYANEAVAKLNTKFGIELPFFEDTTTDYDALDESWSRRLFVTYLSYAVKMNDSSLNEASMYLNQFEMAMMDFEGVYIDVLDSEYLTGNVNGVETMDTSDAVDTTGWFYNNGRGGL